MRTPVAVACAAVCILATGCNRYRHGLRGGTLSEVGSTSVGIYTASGRWKIAIGNEGRDGTCLSLGGLRVTVDGVAQPGVYAGGRSDGQTKGSIGPVDRTDSCDAATVTVATPIDPAKATIVVEASDATSTIRAEFPNVLAPPRWATSPPARVKAGSSFEVAVQPAFPHGTDRNDPGNYLAATIARPGSNVPVSARPSTGGTIQIEVPAGTKPGTGRLILASTQREIAATTCKATSCRASSEFALEAPLTVVP